MSKVFCTDCKYRLKTIPYEGDKSNLCIASSHLIDTPINKQRAFKRCIEKNGLNDCKDYEKKEPVWAKYFRTKR